MGRSPHVSGMFESDEDHAAAARAMALTDTTHLSGRDFRTLSGGEKQRTILAAALAQDPQVLLLDEPTSSLDLSHQVALYRILQDLCRGGMLVVAVTHDLNLAGCMRTGLFCCVRPGGRGWAAGCRDAAGCDRAGVRRRLATAQAGERPAWITYGY
jgi:ABC-type cobalamin/Fe3+-siderophores transport systems, ATPase components